MRTSLLVLTLDISLVFHGTSRVVPPSPLFSRFGDYRLTPSVNSAILRPSSRCPSAQSTYRGFFLGGGDP